MSRGDDSGTLLNADVMALATGFAAATMEAGGARELKRRLTYNDGAGRTRAVTLPPPPAFRDRQATVVYVCKIKAPHTLNYRSNNHETVRGN